MMMSPFENISLKQICILMDILSSSKLLDVEYLKSKYLANALNFEETVIFLKSIGLIIKRKNVLRVQKRIEPLLIKMNKDSDKEKVIGDLINRNLVFKDNGYSYYVDKFLSLFSLENHAFAASLSTAERLQYSGLRNLLLETDFLIHDNKIGKYFISGEYFQRYKNHITSNITSLKKLLKRIEEQQRIGKQAEIAIVKFEKERLQSYPTLIDKIERISVIDVSAGYDIKSFTVVDGKTNKFMERYIEVKAVSPLGHRFYWTRNEIEKSKLHGENYFLYLVPVSAGEEFNLNKLIIIRDPYLNVYEDEGSWARKVEMIEFSCSQNVINKIRKTSNL